MVSIRPMTLKDLLSVQNTNLLCLPENYQQKYYMYHLMSWPGISFIAEDILRSRIVGYVLGKLEDKDEASGKDKDSPHGHITSLAVERSYRRRGIAQRLMEQTSRALIMLYNGKTLTLHVRASNRAAYTLYADVLKFEQLDREVGYYADGEDGLFMKRDLVHHALIHGIQPAERKSFFAGRKLEGMLKHNLEHQHCTPGGVCEKGMRKLCVDDKKSEGGGGTRNLAACGQGQGQQRFTFDAKVPKEGGSGSSSSCSSPAKTPRSPADIAMAARFKGRKEKLKRSISSKKANKENGAENQEASKGGLNIVKI